MILQSLVTLYDTLVAKGKLESPGWSPVKVSWGLEIDDDGNLVRLLPLEAEAAKGKKTVIVPQMMAVPAPVKRSSGVSANFLCDNSSYVLGMDDKGKPERTLQCFEAFRALQEELLGDATHPSAIALLLFLKKWKPDEAANHSALQGRIADVMKGSNIVFFHNGQFLHQISDLRQAWQRAFSDEGGAVFRRCLVTGKFAPVQLLHPNIKGIMGAQSSGASLVSFNAPALESYGCEGAQGLNAPVSSQAAFAYGAALNYLAANPKHHLRMGETTVVFWSEDSEAAYSDFFSSLFDGGNEMDDETLGETLKKIAGGVNASWHDIPLHPDNRFYVLGISPNAARLSIRFFLCNTFGNLMKNVQKHQEDLQIVKPAFDYWNELSLWWLLQETVNQKSRDKTPHPQMAGDVARAILQGTPYPATLFEQVQLRIRAERNVTRGRAAIIKAYLFRQPNFLPKEVLKVQLNEETIYQPYLLGRLFALLEALQQKANPGINATIRDRYFSSACATPAIVFPTLLRLAQAHLKKLDDGWRIHFDKQIGEILGMFSESHPARLSLQDQGVFQLGYYHQTQKRFMKKEEE